MKSFNVSWVMLVWLIIGVIVAINNHYARTLDDGSQVATFIMGILLWPVLAFGGDVFIHF